MTGPVVIAFTTDWARNSGAREGTLGEWSHRLNSSYERLALASGSSPMALLPQPREMLESLLRWGRIDLVVLTGGGRLDSTPLPEQPGEAGPEHSRRLRYPDRTHWEISVYRACLATGTPVLGICHGLQIIALAEGVCLVDDIASGIDSALDHNGSPESPLEHPVEWDDTTLIGRLYRDRPRIGSFHFQGVVEIPPGFRRAARAPDGVLEAFEDRDRRVFAVQWHPEREERGAELVRAILRLEQRAETE